MLVAVLFVLMGGIILCFTEVWVLWVLGFGMLLLWWGVVIAELVDGWLLWVGFALI